MASNPIPQPLRETLDDLGYLSQLKKGLKPNMNSKTFSSDSYLDRFYRTISWESFERNIKDINNCIDTTIRYIYEYKDTEFLPLIIASLAEARQGIESLLVTYRDQPMRTARIRTCLKNIDLQLNKNKQYVPEHLLHETNSEHLSRSVSTEAKTSVPASRLETTSVLTF